MKISSLKVTNFLGIRHFEAAFNEFNLISGFNGSGKSSLQNAIALAFTGMLPRIELKKELGALVHDGTKDATIVLDDHADGGMSLKITAAGKGTGIPNPEDAPWWAHALTDMHYLTSLDPTALRKVLFSHSGGGDLEVIVNKMLQGGADLKLLNQIKPLLKNFEAAEKQAEANTREARGEWKGLTGETYGEVKAETWKAADPAPVKEMADFTVAHRKSMDDAQQFLAEARASAQHSALAASTLKEVRELADRVPDLQAAVKQAEAAVAANEKHLPVLEAKAAGKTGPESAGIHACPECGSVLHVMPDHSLMTSSDYEEGSKGKFDPKAAKALAIHKQAIGVLRATLQNGLNALKRAELAAERIPELEKASQPISDISIEDLQKTANAARDLYDTHIRELGDFRAYSVAVRVAKGKTEQAARAHAAAQGWSKIKELCSPNGVPASFLDGILKAFNDRLAISAQRSGWGQVQIAPDMAITYGQRALALCSESEQWRADAMLTEAVSHITAEGFVMLDRFDVLGMEHRGKLLEWCDSIVADGGQIILLGTLKSKPTFDGVASFWLEGGSLA